MTDPHWTSYVGMVTGISGAIMGFISYRTTTSMKSLDLRIEVKRVEDDFKLTIGRIDEIAKEAKKSRPAVASAIGLLQSGMMVKWEQDLETLDERAAHLQIEFDKRQSNYDRMPPKDLEEALVNLHRMKGIVGEIIGEYEKSIEWDNEMRRDIRANKRSTSPDRRSSFDQRSE